MTVQAERRSLVLRGVLDLCLLALLDQGSVYGYELTTRLAECGLAVGNGTAYPLLARMQRLGLVTVDKRPSQSGPPRKYYALSKAGRRALTEGRAEWDAIAGEVSSVLNAAPRTTRTVARNGAGQ